MLGIARAGPLGPAPFAATDVDADPWLPGGRSGAVRSEREALAVLVSIDGVGPTTLGRLVARLGSAQAVLDVAFRPTAIATLLEASRIDPPGPSGRLGGLTQADAEQIVLAASRADEVVGRIEAAGLEILSIDDADYPARLRATELAPHVLFVRGDRSALSDGRAVGVVGSRQPTDAGRLLAWRTATALAKAGATVISGLAVGIDGAAHAAVVRHLEVPDPVAGEDLPRPGRTVAVLGAGHERLYPRSHRRLAERIVATGGAVVSEFAPDVRPTKGTFPRRNRVISGLAEAVVVIEAGAKSGALTTAAWALDQGRGCYLVPGRIDDPLSAGCLAFLREASAEARVVASLESLLEDLGLGVPVDPSSETGTSPTGTAGAPLSPLVELGPTGRRIGELLVGGLRTADELVAASGLEVATVLGALTLLETRGLVVGAYGRYRPAGSLAGLAPARPVLR
jgi:DNA processing protein